VYRIVLNRSWWNVGFSQKYRSHADSIVPNFWAV